SALGHLAHRLLAHRAEARERAGRYPEVADLCFIRVRHEAAFEPLRAPGHISQRLRYPAAGAGLRRNDAPPGGAQLVTDALRELVQLGLADHGWEATPVRTSADSHGWTRSGRHPPKVSRSNARYPAPGPGIGGLSALPES